MKQTLTKFLESIGQELHREGFTDLSGTIRPITKDEALAREIWNRALGYEVEMKGDNDSMQHRVIPPDPKMQMFIIERREGKVVTPLEEKHAGLLDRISELAKNQSNAVAKQAVGNDRDTDQTDA
ncbi:hypothetical protein LCGC14_1179870 [marine sediment metagenome]|uniref:Uncharacterized protein n=1 Tax=marine sediment metagenome TaxID=412755 RepID=A0A0F9P5H7_9ZZZZ